MALFDPIERAAFRVMWRELGFFRAIKLGIGIQKQQRTGAPFAHLPPAEGEKEVGSRAQAGPAILLYRALKQTMTQDEALQVAAAVIEAGAIVFLTRSLGPLRRADVAALTPAEQQTFAKERQAKFPNAEVRWDHIGADAVRFTVERCRFVSLCAETGVSELAPMFCRGDATFFGSVEPGVVLIRPETLAEGGASCPFELRWSHQGVAKTTSPEVSK